MISYSYNPTDHSITRHAAHKSPMVIAYVRTEAPWSADFLSVAANTILRDACGPRVAAQYWPAFKDAFKERLNPLAHWQITCGDHEHIGEIDVFMARQRRAKREEADYAADRALAVELGKSI